MVAERGMPGQLAFDIEAAPGTPQGTHAAASNGHSESGVRTLTEPQNGSYAAAVREVRACSGCHQALTPGDVGQRRHLCAGCRARREQDLEAERSFRAGTVGRPSRCHCLRWAFSVNGDMLGRRCGKCGKRP